MPPPVVSPRQGYNIAPHRRRIVQDDDKTPRVNTVRTTSFPDTYLVFIYYALVLLFIVARKKKKRKSAFRGAAENQPHNNKYNITM